MREKYPSTTIQSFTHDIGLWSKPKNILLIDATGEFSNLSKKKAKEYDIYEKWFPLTLDGLAYNSNIEYLSHPNWEMKMPNEGKFDLIFANFPIGMQKKPNQIYDPKGKLWGRVTSYLSPSGRAVFLVNQHLAGRMEEGFKDNNIHVEAIINTPKTYLKHLMGVTLNIVIVGKKPVKKIFYSELPSSDNDEDSDIVRNTALNFIKKKDTGDLETGTFLKDHKFTSFGGLRATFKIEKLESIYKDFKSYSIEDLAVKKDSEIKVTIGTTGITFKETHNSVYIPRIGNGPVVCSIDELTMKHQNYHQVCLNESAINNYVSCFYHSQMGKLSLEVSKTGATIPHISKSALLKLLIPLPDKKIQNKILSIYETIESLQSHLNLLKEELAVNPMNISNMDEIDAIASTISNMTTADNIRSLILKGESKTREFKETFSLNLHTKNRDKEIEFSALKTIVGFLNTEGGKLIIGVNDASLKIVGVDNEIKKQHMDSSDKYLLHFKNAIKEHIGIDYSEFIEYNLMQIDNVNLLIVDCLKSNRPCYVDKVKFYVRTNPSTDLLEGDQFLKYIETHFKNR
jgi:hypothetical protein